jgi:hypothetical protein
VSCRFVATDQPRVYRGRHSNPCECDGDFGCLPCLESHCVVCGRVHAAVTCTECLEAARSDLRAIGDLCSALPEEAAVKGVDSEAMMLLGPAANPEAWKHRMISAAYWGRLDPAYLEDCRDELHPVWVLGTWEQVWRDHLEHYTENPFTLAAGWSYLDKQIGYMSDQPEPAFEEFARDLRSCRRHLEDVLRDGIRDEKGAPCVQCERPMVKTGDWWDCRKCHRLVNEDQYRYAVGVAYIAHSDRLTATELGGKLSVKPSIIRVWGARGLVRKRGRNQDGVTLYDVADAEARHELGGEAG